MPGMRKEGRKRGKRWMEECFSRDLPLSTNSTKFSINIEINKTLLAYSHSVASMFAQVTMVQTTVLDPL